MAAAQAQRRSGDKVGGFSFLSCVKAKEPRSGRRRTECGWFRVGSPCSWTSACFSPHPCPTAHRLTIHALFTLPTPLPHCPSPHNPHTLHTPHTPAPLAIASQSTHSSHSPHTCPTAHRLTIQAFFTLPTPLPHCPSPHNPGTLPIPQTPAPLPIASKSRHSSHSPHTCPTLPAPQAVLLTKPNNPLPTMYCASLDTSCIHHTCDPHFCPHFLPPRPCC